MYLPERAQHVLNRILYRMPDRYGHLTREIIRGRARAILEIGVWDAEHACQMIKAALRHHRPSEVVYHGFDLFESADDGMVEREVSKPPPSLEMVSRKLQPFRDIGVAITLHQGDTTKLLPETVPSMPTMDFVFIDGGHSFETVSSDWSCVRQVLGPHSIVIFDDYSNAETIANENLGVNTVVDRIDRQSYSVEPLRPIDGYQKSWGVQRVRFVRVRPRVHRPAPYVAASRRRPA